jgi:hypothetical protein
VLYKLAPDSPMFNITAHVTLNEPAAEDIIKKVFEKLVLRHDSFRTYFRELKGEPVQVILPQSPVPLECIDLSGLTETEQEQTRLRLRKEESLMGFNIETPPLFRVKLVTCKPHCFELIFTMHHIVSDGWSMEILENEFLTLYHRYKKDAAKDPEPLRIQYKDYAVWHNRLISDIEKIKAAKEFWENQFSRGCDSQPPLLQLPYDFSRKSLKTKESSGYRTVVPETIIDQLKSLGRQYNASLFMVLLAGFNLFLSRISGKKDILIAVPGAARQHDDLKNIVGFFVNTLILRNQVDWEETFIDFLKRVQDNTLQVLEYQSYPLELICSQLKIKYPEISVFFNMSIFGEQNQQYLETSAAYHLDFVQDAKFDIACYLTEYKNGIEINTHYYKQLFKPEKIEKLMHLYLKILENISRDQGKKVSDYTRPEKRIKISL